MFAWSLFGRELLLIRAGFLKLVVLDHMLRDGALAPSQTRSRSQPLLLSPSSTGTRFADGAPDLAPSNWLRLGREAARQISK